MKISGGAVAALVGGGGLIYFSATSAFGPSSNHPAPQEEVFRQELAGAQQTPPSGSPNPQGTPCPDCPPGQVDCSGLGLDFDGGVAPWDGTHLGQPSGGCNGVTDQFVALPSSQASQHPIGSLVTITNSRTGQSWTVPVCDYGSPRDLGNGQLEVSGALGRDMGVWDGQHDATDCSNGSSYDVSFG